MSGLHLNTGGRASDVRAFAEEVEAIGASLRDVPLQVAGRYYHVWLGNSLGRLSRDRTPLPDLN